MQVVYLSMYGFGSQVDLRSYKDTPLGHKGLTRK